MVTYTLMVIISIVSLSTLIWPSLTSVLGGIGELSHPWQPWTVVFVHGWPGVPTILHLAGNLVLLAFVGLSLEWRLGAIRFLVLTLLAIFSAGLVRILSGVDTTALLLSFGLMRHFCGCSSAMVDKLTKPEFYS